MDKFSLKTAQNFCRACLKKFQQRQKFKISTLNMQIRHWLEDASLTLHLTDDEYPNSICKSCLNKLQTFLKFYELCKKSTKTIQNMLTHSDKKFEDETTIKIEPDIIMMNMENAKDEQAGEENFLAHKDNASITEPNINILDKHLNSHYVEFESDTTEHNNCSNENLDDSESNPIYSARPYEKEFHINTMKRSKLSKTRMKRQKYPYTFRCEQCECLCMSQQTLDIHNRIHYGLKPYQCPKCDESFDKSTFMLKHLDKIHNEKKINITCEYKDCGNQFTSIRSYKNHYREFHLPRTLNRHVCEECGKTYAKMQIFKEHQYTHGPKELYPFQCNQCDKAFVKQTAFEEHKLRHAGIKNFECPHCGIKKTTKKELKNHMNYHSKERPYPCPHCLMVFYTSTNYRMHVDVVHQGIRRFACRYCDKSFGKGDNLKKHELLHTGEKPHVCTECGKRFVQKVSLRTHMKTHNNLY